MTIRNVSRTVEMVQEKICERIDRKNGVPTSPRHKTSSTRVFHAGGMSSKELWQRDQRDMKNAYRL